MDPVLDRQTGEQPYPDTSGSVDVPPSIPPMTPHIKVFVGSLFILAFASLAFFADIFKVSLPEGFASSGSSSSQSSIGNLFAIDTDRDGLTDGEEVVWGTDFQNPDTDGDGFLDGEEVASGHNPRIPAPNDALNLSKQNITERVSQLILSGLYTESLNPDRTEFQSSLDQITTAAISQYEINTGEEAVPAPHIVPNSAATESAYREDALPVLSAIAQNVPRGLIRLSEAAYETQKQKSSTPYESFFSTEISDIAQYRQRLVDVHVPERWEHVHRGVLSFLTDVIRSYAALQHSEEDPFQSLIAYSNLVSLLTDGFQATFAPYESIF